MTTLDLVGLAHFSELLPYIPCYMSDSCRVLIPQGTGQTSSRTCTVIGQHSTLASACVFLHSHPPLWITLWLLLPTQGCGWEEALALPHCVISPLPSGLASLVSVLFPPAMSCTPLQELWDPGQMLRGLQASVLHCPQILVTGSATSRASESQGLGGRPVNHCLVTVPQPCGQGGWS